MLVLRCASVDTIHFMCSTNNDTHMESGDALNHPHSDKQHKTESRYRHHYGESKCLINLKNT